MHQRTDAPLAVGLGAPPACLDHSRGKPAGLAEQIAVGDDSNYLLPAFQFLDDGQMPYIGLVHPFEGIAQVSLGLNRDHLLRHDRSDIHDELLPSRHSHSRTNFE